MCGIFALLGHHKEKYDEYKSKCIINAFNKGKNRGPETSTWIDNYDYNFSFGFHRLAINGLDNNSDQPINIDTIKLICNGEIFNYQQLYNELNIKPKTNSDCEVIIHLYKKYGIEQTLHMLDGEFSFILFDEEKQCMYACRDPYGIRPLYIYNNKATQIISFSSELKCLTSLDNIFYDEENNTLLDNDECLITQFTPGHYIKLDYIDNFWSGISNTSKGYVKYHGFGCLEVIGNQEMFQQQCYNYLCNAVKKRVINTDRPVACLLSGGLDSSLVAALASKYYKGTLETYSIGMEGAEDLKYSQMVADHIGSKHTQITLTEEEFFNSINDVIYAIESYDTTTVRASVGNYLVGKYISENSEAKVILNGDGADELMGGYMYFHKCPDMIEFDKECRNLLTNIHSYDVLRSDKSISSNGLEPRTPFLDKSFVEYYLSIPKHIRYFPGQNKCEKFLIRNTVEKYSDDLLPKEVLWRTKEAFSDGVSSIKNSWYEIIRSFLSNVLKENKEFYNYNYNFLTNIKDTFNFNKNNSPHTTEQIYYFYLFNKHFPMKNVENIIRYYWMPKYIEAHDSSARTLKVYQEVTTQKEEDNEPYSLTEV